MFTPGDYVVYSIEGVCRVEEAGRLNVPGLERGRDYYRLTPYYRGGVIYTPVGGKATIRPVMTKTALQALLPELPGLPELTDVPTDIKQQSGFYREILAAHDCRKLLQLCKTIYNKSRSSSPPGAEPSAPPSFAAGKPPKKCSIRSLPLSSASSRLRSRPIWKMRLRPENRNPSNMHKRGRCIPHRPLSCLSYVTRNDCASRRRIKAEKSLSNENTKRSPSSISWQEMSFLASLTQTAMFMLPPQQ